MALHRVEVPCISPRVAEGSFEDSEVPIYCSEVQGHSLSLFIGVRHQIHTSVQGSSHLLTKSLSEAILQTRSFLTLAMSCLAEAAT